MSIVKKFREFLSCGHNGGKRTSLFVMSYNMMAPKCNVCTYYLFSSPYLEVFLKDIIEIFLRIILKCYIEPIS